MKKAELEKEIKKLRNLINVRKYRKKYPDRVKESSRKSYKANPKKRMNSHRKWWLKNKDKPYWRNRTREYANKAREAHRKKKLLAATGKEKAPKRCEICKGTGKICFDHCHKRGHFRGWLCQNCNFAIGHARDNPRILRKLASYLEEGRKKRIS